MSNKITVTDERLSIFSSTDESEYPGAGNLPDDSNPRIYRPEVKFDIQGYDLVVILCYDVEDEVDKLSLILQLTDPDLVPYGLIKLVTEGEITAELDKIDSLLSGLKSVKELKEKLN